MKTPTTQITVRGLDGPTKAALAQRAAQRGLSMNKFALESLKQSAGTDSSAERYHSMKQFLSQHHITLADAQAFDQAITWSDKASAEKQRRDEHDSSV
jgi:plasmid stability protein